jgi:Ca2+-binding EF-hand superfamily protein
MHSLRNKIHDLTLDQVSEVLKRFQNIDVGKDGLIGPEEFVAALGVKSMLAFGEGWCSDTKCCRV